MKSNRVTIRAASDDEAPIILEFIRKKAAFDVSMKAFNGTLQTSEQAIQETLFSIRLSPMLYSPNLMG